MSIQNKKGIILFGAPVREGSKASIDLSKMQIDLIKLAPCDVKVTVANDAQQYRYALYKDNLPAFMKALDGRKTSLLWTFKGLTERGPLPGFPTLPDVMVDFPGRMSDDVRDSIMNSIPATRITEIVKRNRRDDKYIYTLSGVPLSRMATLRDLPSVNSITPVFDNTINIDVFGVWMLSLRIINKFALLHNYPSFMDKDHFDQFDEQRGNQPHWRPRTDVMDTDEEDTHSEPDPATDFTEDHMFEDGQMSSFGIWKTKSVRGGTVAPPQIAAKSAEIKIDDIENGGYFAPFVPELALYDTKTVPSIIRDRFYGTLGEDEEEAAEVMDDLIKGWGILGKTDAGKALTHAYFCADLALRGQLTFKVMTNDVGYCGTVMEGYGTNIQVEGRLVQYAELADLKANIRDADQHARAINQLRTVVGDSVTWEAINSMATLKQALAAVALSEDQRSSVLQIAPRLNFRIPSWKINASSFETFFALLNESGPLPENLPIHHSCIFETDRLRVLLSCFGDFAPTFRVPGGRVTPLDTMLATTVDTRTGAKSTVPTTKIACRSVELATALGDWRKIREEKTILNPFLQPKAKVSQEHFTRIFDGGAFNSIVAGLRRFSTSSAVAASGPSGKRKDAPSGGDDQNTKRRKRALEY